MKICFLGQFHVVISNALVEHSSYLFEDLAEVLLKLRSKAIEELLNVLANLVSVDLGQIGLYFLVDPANQPL